VLLGNVVLLSSAALETEHAFGRLCPPSARRILVGGLGFGATVRGALEVVGQDAAVVVAEKVGAIEQLARTELAPIVAGALDDPRVQVVRSDVAELYARGPWDAILLDVDNGTEWASFRTNARLYSAPLLEAARAALGAGGLFAVWSGYPADAFLGKLRKAGFVASTAPLLEKGVVRARAYVGRA